MNNNIDFVITWVDASDSSWLEKKNNALRTIGEPMDEATGDERFRDYGTLKYLLRSIEKYAAWVHRIYLITDNQKPSWMKQNLDKSKLEIVDHKSIIPNESLPTFDSNAIELCIDNINGLTENFVEFNDDFLINKNVNPEDFFIDGKPRDYRLYKAFLANTSYDRIQFNDAYAINNLIHKIGKWPLSKKGIFSVKYPIRSNFRNLYFLLDSHGSVSNYVLSHNALSLTKKTFAQAKNIWEEEIQFTIQQKFRSENDVSIFLLRNFQLEAGNFIPRSPKFSKYFTLNDIENLCRDLRAKKHSLLCINDAGTLDYQQSVVKLQAELEKKFPKKSSFEK